MKEFKKAIKEDWFICVLVSIILICNKIFFNIVSDYQGNSIYNFISFMSCGKMYLCFSIFMTILMRFSKFWKDAVDQSTIRIKIGF